ncbi:hypothetical protein D3C75_704320 [compost metagenome]
MRRNMHMLHIALADQLGVDLFLFRYSQVIRHRHNNHAGLQRLVLFIGDKGFVLCFVGMGYDKLIRADQRKPSGLEISFLGQGQQVPQELLVAFEHFLEFHQAAVGLVQLPVKPVGARIGFRAVFGNGREVDATGQVGNIL